MTNQLTGRPNKVKQAGVEGVVRKLAADGLGYREIAAELQARGHDISYGAVGRFISEEIGERREIATSVVVEQAYADVPLVTGSLRTWVKDIGVLVQKTLVNIEKAEGDPEEHDKRLNRAAASVSTLVNAGSKAAKLLHDITMGAEPASAADAFMQEAQAILEAKRKREAELAELDDEGDALH